MRTKQAPLYPIILKFPAEDSTEDFVLGKYYVVIEGVDYFIAETKSKPGTDWSATKEEIAQILETAGIPFSYAERSFGYAFEKEGGDYLLVFPPEPTPEPQDGNYLGRAKAKLEELTTALKELEQSPVVAHMSGESQVMSGIAQVSESLGQIAHTLEDPELALRGFDWRWFKSVNTRFPRPAPNPVEKAIAISREIMELSDSLQEVWTWGVMEEKEVTDPESMRTLIALEQSIAALQEGAVASVSSIGILTAEGRGAGGLQDLNPEPTPEPTPAGAKWYPMSFLDDEWETSVVTIEGVAYPACNTKGYKEALAKAGVEYGSFCTSLFSSLVWGDSVEKCYLITLPPEPTPEPQEE